MKYIDGYSNEDTEFMSGALNWLTFCLTTFLLLTNLPLLSPTRKYVCSRIFNGKNEKEV